MATQTMSNRNAPPEAPPASHLMTSNEASIARADVKRPEAAASRPADAQVASSAKRSWKRGATASAEATASATRSKASIQRCDLARRGENLVASLLAERGFTIIGRNIRVGRLELDVIARRGSLVVVCEVRSRRSARPIFPAETLQGKKLERVRRATAMWLRREKLGKVHARIDAAAVVFDGSGGEARIEYYENVSFPFRSV